MAPQLLGFYRNDINSNDLLMAINSLLKGSIEDKFYVKRKGFSIEVDRNDEYDLHKQKDFPDGFLYFPYLILVNVEEYIGIEESVKTIGSILKFYGLMTTRL